MNRYRLFCCGICMVAIALFVDGCTRVYWDDQWSYQGTVRTTESQTIALESEPAAAVWLDGAYAGRTPLTLQLDYPRSRMTLVRHQYRDNGRSREVTDREERIRELALSATHTLRFRAPGYHDLFIPVAVPRKEGTLSVSLREKSGIRHPLTCTFHIRAQAELYPMIEEIIRRHTATPEIAQLQPDPPPGGSTDLVARTLRFVVPDGEAFNALYGDLDAAAKQRRFVFNALESSAEAVLATNPVREMRAVWISYLDWPREITHPDAQRRALTEMLERFSRLNFNTVIFQVRPACDAYYRSAMEPWSRFLTGTEGGDPGYDPLALAVSEAHKRGMALHAWLNPYRAWIGRACGDGKGIGMDPRHPAVRHPDWVLTLKTDPGRCYRMLDPGIPAVTDHIAEVVTDIVTRYDVDGIHLDDMFYPYPGELFPGMRHEDRETYRKYGTGRAADWRRENVNRMIAAVRDAVKGADPLLQFGVSPFGIWRRGTPAGISGLSAYDVIYADPLAWLKQGSVDYLAPQLYWKIGGRTDYAALLGWWADQARAAGRHIYPGLILSYLEDAGETPASDAKPRSIREIVAQLHLNRASRSRNVLGNIFFRAGDIQASLPELAGLRAALETGVYATPALPPVMPWLDTTPPASPEEARMAVRAGQPVLLWSASRGTPAPRRYAVYAVFAEDRETGGEPAEMGRLVAVTGETAIEIAPYGLRAGDALFVTAVSGNNVESAPGRMVMVPGSGVTASPGIGIPMTD